MGRFNKVSLLSVYQAVQQEGTFLQDVSSVSVSNCPIGRAILTRYVCRECIKRFNRKGQLNKVCLLSVLQTVQLEGVMFAIS